jgi:hypothetical protein
VRCAAIARDADALARGGNAIQHGAWHALRCSVRARFVPTSLAAVVVCLICLEANARAEEPGGGQQEDPNSSSSSSSSSSNDSSRRRDRLAVDSVGGSGSSLGGGSSFGSRPFTYTTPASRYYLRATLEELLVLGLGYAQYAANKAGNEVDWDLAPSWSSIEKKLTLSALSFDNNKFDTNWLTHPGAGYFYYLAARSNRLSIPVSLLFTTLSSTLWEYFGEIREHAAINDLIATPLTALPLGEATLHLGAFFQRGRKTFGTTAASWVFAPLKNVHDAIDDLDPARAPAGRTDDLFGLPTDEDTWHRIKVGSSVGVTHQSSGSSDSGGGGGKGLTQGDVRVYASSRIVAIPGYGTTGMRGGWFTEGEVSDLQLQTSVSLADGGLVDFDFGAHVLPLGYAYQNVDRDARDGRLRGHGFVAGLNVGAEYSRHDYDRDRRRDRDRIALVASGATFEERLHTGLWTIRAGVDGLATFSGVEAYALPEETREHSDIHLVSVLRNEHYYHAYGATFHPRLEIEKAKASTSSSSGTKPVVNGDVDIDFGSDLRVDWFDSILHRDVDAGAVDTNSSRLDASDRRIVTRAWVGLHPTPYLRISLTSEFREREGRVASTRSSRSELGLHTGIELLF